MRYGQKYILFPVCYLLSGSVFVYSFYHFLYTEAVSFGTGNLMFVGVSLVVFGICTSLFFLFESSFGNFLLPHFLLGGLFLFLFRQDIGPYAWHYGAGLLVTMLFFVFGWRRIQVERNERILMHLRKILPRGLPMVFTAVALLLALAYFFSPSSGIQKGPQEIRMPRAVFDVALGPLEDLVFSRVSFYRKGMSAQNFFFLLDTVLSPELVRGEDGKAVSSGEKRNALRLLQDQERARLAEDELARERDNQFRMEEIRTKYSEQLGVAIFPEDTIEDALYNLINVQLTNVQVSFAGALPAVFAVGVFFTVKALSLPLMWLIIFLTAGTVKFLKFVKVVTVEEVDTKKEVFVIN